MILNQFVHTISYGDAISGEALSLQRIAREAGIGGDIYCVHAHPALKSSVKRITDYQEQGEGESVVLHYSIASPLNDLYCTLKSAKRAMIYHNLTPDHWFHSYNRRVVDDLKLARAGLTAVIDASDHLVGDSTYNCQELTEILKQRGRTVVPRVLPLLIDQQKWSVTANAGIAGLMKGHGGTNILSVGRIAPNKCFEDVLRSFYFYHHKINQKSKLWIVGSDTDTEIYSFELRDLTRSLNLEHAVTFAGPVADSELKAFYENADLYVSMSEHEGFCVPLIEAMHFQVPVIAYDTGAVLETVGNGGFVVREKAFAEIAELMQLVLTKNEIKFGLRERGKRQVENYSEASFRALLTERLIEPLLNLSVQKQTSASLRQEAR